MTPLGKLRKVNQIARSLGRTEKISVSNSKTHKYVVHVNGKTVHFGHPDYEDYLDHRDKERRKRYLTRAKAIRNKKGELTHLNPESANFWSVHVLW